MKNKSRSHKTGLIQTRVLGNQRLRACIYVIIYYRSQLQAKLGARREHDETNVIKPGIPRVSEGSTNDVASFGINTKTAGIVYELNVLQFIADSMTFVRRNWL